jgi:hypothetical protein
MSTPCPTCGRQSEIYENELVDAALERLEPSAVAVLESQLDSKDERVRQSAAKLLLEWRRGKPKQQVQTTGEQVTVIRYESAAWLAEDPNHYDAPKEITVGGPPEDES